jgi:hypothetical protein
VIYKPFDVEEVLSVIEKIFRLPALNWGIYFHLI